MRRTSAPAAEETRAGQKPAAADKRPTPGGADPMREQMIKHLRGAKWRNTGKREPSRRSERES